MAFKIICQKCGQEGIFGETQDGTVKSEKQDGTIKSEEDVFTLRYGQLVGGVDSFALTCNKCGNEIAEESL